jgi:hypothetical protein
MQPLLILTISLSLFACRAPREAAKNTNSNPDIQESAVQLAQIAPQDLQFKTAEESPDVFVSMERTACFGTCPIYKMMVLQNGQALYEGIQHVEMEGRYTSTFSKSEMHSILEKADEYGFWKLNEKYDSPVTDFPTTFTSLRKGKQVKMVEHRVAGPGALKAFEDYIDSLIKSKEWKRIDN